MLKRIPDLNAVGIEIMLQISSDTYPFIGRINAEIPATLLLALDQNLRRQIQYTPKKDLQR